MGAWNGCRTLEDLSDEFNIIYLMSSFFTGGYLDVITMLKWQ